MSTDSGKFTHTLSKDFYLNLNLLQTHLFKFEFWHIPYDDLKNITH